MTDNRWRVVWRELALALLRHGYCATEAALQWAKQNKFPPLLVRDVAAALAVETFDHDFGYAWDQVSARDYPQWNFGVRVVMPIGWRPERGERERQRGLYEQAVESLRARQLSVELEQRLGKEARPVILGHVQRGGTPTAYDRVLATRFGVNAADAAHAGEYGMMVSLRGSDIGRVPLSDATRQLKLVPQTRYDDAAAFFG